MPPRNPNNLFDQPEDLVEDYDDPYVEDGCPDGPFCELCNPEFSDEDVL